MVFHGTPVDLLDGSGRLWSFAGREFDEARLELRVEGKPAELELKPLEVLVQLLQRAGEVVTKEELLESVWPGLTVVDGSLSTAIYKLRRAIRDEDSSVIVTVPRVGYRLAVAVHSQSTRSTPTSTREGFIAGNPVPGREHWSLVRSLDISQTSEVWLAEHPQTGELRVFKFVSNLAGLKGLRREATVFRFLRESLGERPEFVRILEWNFDSAPYYLESEYGGFNLKDWAQSHGGLPNISFQRRLNVLAAIARTVSTAHGVGVLHKDLKPANVLVTPTDGQEQIKVADFGSASLIEPARLKALGITNLGFTQTATSRSASLTGTLMYLAPEVLCGQSPTAASDVYALGVMLYQFVVGDFRKPLSPGWEADIPDSLLREDIAAAACGDPARRIGSASELAERLLSLEQRRSERNRRDDLQKRKEFAQQRNSQARASLPWMVMAALAILIVLGLTLHFRGRAFATIPPANTLAVLPFQNTSSDPNLDFLRLALPDEVATTLSYKRSLSIRPFATSSKYMAPNLDLRKAGLEMGVSIIITGHFQKLADQLQVTLEAVDVASNRLLWRDTIDVPSGNLLAMQEQITATAREGLAPVFGSSPFTAETGAPPHNEEAYDLYLHSLAMAGDVIPNRNAIPLLEQSVDLDPNYAPAWRALALRYYNEGHYGAGGEAMIQRGIAAAERSRALEPNFTLAVALLAETKVEHGELAPAYQEVQELVRRRPDSADAHFALSYVLRYAGLLEEAARQCEQARALDPHNPGWRSCSAVFELRGDYKRAADYIHLDDPGSDWARPHLIELYLHQGKEREAEAVPPTHIPQWISFTMLQACAAHRPSTEITALASNVRGEQDPEVDYFFASHLSYCGQTAAAVQLLKRAIQGNYCSYPAIDSDSFFAKIRTEPEFPEIRSAAIACQQNFLAAR